MKPMSEEEAILQMELVDHDFYVFKDIKTEQVSIIYKRKEPFGPFPYFIEDYSTYLIETARLAPTPVDSVLMCSIPDKVLCTMRLSSGVIGSSWTSK